MRRAIFVIVAIAIMTTAAEAKKKIQLEEVTVTSHKRSVLHTIGYVREFSELTTYGDTVFMFREKWVDFMTPGAATKNYMGWHLPRILSSKSYYRFTNSAGLDSVSDSFSHHFSWSDWVRIPSRIRIPKSILDETEATDTVFGRNRPTEIWRCYADGIDLSVNVLAAPESRRWVSGLDDFFARGVDFERFDVRYLFKAVNGETIWENNLEAMTFNIESNGRGMNIFRVNRLSEPYSIKTYAELYVADREQVSVSEARKRERNRPEFAYLESLKPYEIGNLDPKVLALIERVEGIDHNALRMQFKPDENLVGLSLKPLSRKDRILNRLRGLVGLPRKGIRASKYEQKSQK